MTRRSTYYIVDDDIDDQNFLIEAITANDHYIQCFTAPNGKLAIQELKNSINPLPDAIFLDLNMPKYNGKQCLAELKRTPALKHIPVVIYSTSSYKKEMQDAMKMGASYFMIKKSSIKELQDELARIANELNI